MKPIRKKVFSLLLCLILLLTGCQPQADAARSELKFTHLASMTSREREIYMQMMERYLSEYDEWLLENMALPSGGVLSAIAPNEKHPKRYNKKNDPLYIEFSYIDFTVNMKDQKTDYVTNTYNMPNLSMSGVCIFYPEDWQARAKNTKKFFLAESYFIWHEGLHGKDALIFVVPDDVGKEVPYEKSEWYGSVPSDNLGTKPMVVRHPCWRNNYPCWVFAVPEAQIKESYELHYMDYVLTGSDLLNNTWQNGDAPIMPPRSWE